MIRNLVIGAIILIMISLLIWWFTPISMAPVPVSTTEGTENKLVLPTPSERPERDNTTNNVGGGIACTMEAKLCPDGTYVSRIAPNCEFAICPAP
ncbi:MAG: hypothetical protein HYV76_00160 [Candidatus Vogelbacteria bacterium]|nr:hypothetical protein [Candidatus Vogelbacteria bacterium]